MTLTQLILSFGIICLLTACGGGSSPKTVTTASSQMTKSVASSSLAPNSSSLSNSSATSSSSRSSSSLSSNSSIKATLLSYGSNKMQVGELRLPNKNGGTPSPLVIIIHGGCWVSSYADYHFMDKFAQAITDLGYATWNIEYRALGTGGNWPIIFQDVNKAVDYSRELAQNYPIDINKVAVIGHSAGGHLALWTASRANIKSTSDVYTENPLSIRGVISLAGIANVTGNNSCGGLASDVIGVPISPSSNTLSERLLDTSPLQMLPIKIKTILISGGSDGIVPPSMGTEYSTEATKLGDDSLHYILQGLGHFDLIDSTKTNWALYQQSLQEIFKD